MNNWIYISVASRNVLRTGPPATLGEDLCSTIIASAVFKKAYKSGLTTAGILKPSIGYRKAIDRIKKEGALQVQDKLDPSVSITLVRIKKI